MSDDYIQMPHGRIRWRTLASGEVEADGKVPTLAGQHAAAFDAKVWRWEELACKHAQRTGLPAHWLLGTIYAESSGNPSVVSPDGGYGLMQLTHSSVFQGHPKHTTIDDPGDPSDDVTDPDRNIELGADLLRKLHETLPDLPRIASGYNAGTKSGEPHPSSKSPWGMRETPGHISRVVAAANYALGRLRAEYGSGAPSSPPSSGGDALQKLGTVLLVAKLLRWFA